jgi:hypothetical protein
VVLVTLDGVRWEDAFAGTAHGPDLAKRGVVMPNLHRIVGERGAAFGGSGCAFDMRVSGPTNLSLPGYMEIFSGRASTTCLANDCPRTTNPTLLDDVRAKTSARDVAVFSSWSPYGRAASRAPKSLTSSLGGEMGTVAKTKVDATLEKLLEAGAAAGPFPGWMDYRPDAHTARAALRYLEIAAPRLLVVGLGDADEHAHRGDVDGYYRAVRAADDFLLSVDATLERMGEAGRRTTVIVTTDHGRARTIRDHGPGLAESARVWAAAWNGAIVRRGVTCSTQPLRLAHVAPAVRAILELDADGGALGTELLGGLTSAP